MKKFILSVCLCAAIGTAAAQDIIITHKAEQIEAKVTKIGLSEIEYLKWERQQGPVYVLPKHEVFFIKFADGTKEIITPSESRRTAQPAPTPRTQPPYDWAESAEKSSQTEPSEPIGIKPWSIRHPRQPRTFGHDAFPRYQGEIAFAYGLGVGAASKVVDTNRIVFETVHGVRISPYVFAGMGVGFNYFYNLLGEPTYDNDSGEARQYVSGSAMPLFANAKGYYPLGDKLSVYVSLDMGVGIPIAGSLKSINSQFYTAVGPGITLGKKFRSDFGIRFQHMGKGTNAVLFRIGFGF